MTDLEGIIILQVYDSFGIGSTWILWDEGSVAQHFTCKYRTVVATTTLPCNGSDLVRPNDRTIIMRHTEKIGKLRHPSDQIGFSSHWAMDKYIGVNTRTEICPPSNSQHLEETPGPRRKKKSKGGHQTLK